MNFLLDTHTFIWYIEGNQKLSLTAKDTIESSENRVYLSIASLWEMGIKIAKGRLKLNNDFDNLMDLLNSLEIEVLSIDFSDIQIYKSLPFHHADPFDRMLISQAINRNFTLISCDQVFNNYSVSLLWE